MAVLVRALAVSGLVLAWVIWRRLPEPARGGQSRLQPGALEIKGEDDIDLGAAAIGDSNTQPGRGDELTAQEVKRRAVAPHEELVLREDPARMSAWRAAVYVLRVHTNVRLIIASALGCFFFAGLRTFAVVYVRGHFGVGQSEATLLLGVIVIASIAGALLGGRAADRLIRAGRLLIAAGAYAAAAVILGPAIATTSLAVAIPLYILGAAALAGPNPPLDAARLDIMPARLLAPSGGGAHPAVQLRRGARPVPVRRDLRAARRSPPQRQPRQAAGSAPSRAPRGSSTRF